MEESLSLFTPIVHYSTLHTQTYVPHLVQYQEKYNKQDINAYLFHYNHNTIDTMIHISTVKHSFKYFQFIMSIGEMSIVDQICQETACALTVFVE